MASGYRTGGLHTGGVTQQGADHVHGQTGALHGGGMGTGPQVTNTDHAPVAESRDLHNHSSHEKSTSTSMNRGDKVGVVEKAVNAYARIITLLACLLALGAVLVYLGGLGSLQHRSDNTDTGAGYTETFQSSLQVPYAGAAHNQWAFQWYIGAVEVFVIMLVLFMLCLPQRILQRFKAAAMVLLGYALVLFTYETQSLLFLKRNGTATGLFSRKRILITLIGCIVVAIADGLMLLNLSLLKETNRDLLGPGGKRVAEEHQERNTDNYGEHEHRELHGGHHGPNAV